MKKKSKGQMRLYLYFTSVIFLALAVTSGVSGLLSWLLPMDIPPVLVTIIFFDILGMGVAVVISHNVLRPMTRLSQAMEQVARGDFKVRLEEKSKLGEIQELYDNFNLMVTELSATEVLQSDFVSNVSHEFKTPINAIEGYTMLLQEDCTLSQEQGEYARKILFNTKRLSGLVSNILLLSKIDNQSIPARQEQFRLDEQIRQAIVFLEPKWSEKEIDLEAELEKVTFSGNEQLLLHVWLNLIDNAVKFSPPEGQVEIRLKASEQNVLVSVRDSGPGISPGEQKRIFDKFYQADSSHKNEGNGLGLALVRQVVTLHRGTIDVENVLGGCKFTVVLPILPPEQE
ncbi:MAG: HAMP domain-containing sensor histidine kinase [Eubacteriales bacterium]|nr:HAMP domain-containing sensor histidine kinase [Eubacteriales bacterium]